MEEAISKLVREKGEKLFVEKYSTEEIRKGKKVGEMSEREFTLALIKTKRKIFPEMEAKGLVYFNGEFVKPVVKEHTEGLAKEMKDAKSAMFGGLNVTRLENMIEVYTEAQNLEEAKKLLAALKKGTKPTTGNEGNTVEQEHIAKSAERFIDDWMIKQLEEAETASFWVNPSKKIELKLFKSWDVVADQEFKWSDNSNRVPLEVESNSGKSVIYINITKVGKGWKISSITK